VCNRWRFSIEPFPISLSRVVSWLNFSEIFWR
jgi:hypothetical protein